MARLNSPTVRAMLGQGLVSQPLQDTKGSTTRVKVHRDVVSSREIATLCGPPFTEVDIFELGDEMGFKGAFNRYRRLEARLIIAKLMVRASDPDVVSRLLDAYASLAVKNQDGVLA